MTKAQKKKLKKKLVNKMLDTYNRVNWTQLGKDIGCSRQSIYNVLETDSDYPQVIENLNKWLGE